MRRAQFLRAKQADFGSSRDKIAEDVGSAAPVLALVFAGWVNRRQVEVIEYLQEETRHVGRPFGDARGPRVDPVDLVADAPFMDALRLLRGSDHEPLRSAPGESRSGPSQCHRVLR